MCLFSEKFSHYASSFFSIQLSFSPTSMLKGKSSIGLLTLRDSVMTHKILTVSLVTNAAVEHQAQRRRGERRLGRVGRYLQRFGNQLEAGFVERVRISVEKTRERKDGGFAHLDVLQTHAGDRDQDLVPSLFSGQHLFGQA